MYRLLFALDIIVTNQRFTHVKSAPAQISAQFREALGCSTAPRIKAKAGRAGKTTRAQTLPGAEEGTRCKNKQGAERQLTASKRWKRTGDADFGTEAQSKNMF